MWAGALGHSQRVSRVCQQAPGYFGWDREEIEAWLLANTSHTPLELLAAGRWWVVLGVTLALVLGYFPLRRLLGANIAFFAILYLALSPFIVALARQLHPDGLVSSFIFLALLYFLAWLYAGSPLVGSGHFRRGDGAGLAHQDAGRVSRPHRAAAGGAGGLAAALQPPQRAGQAGRGLCPLGRHRHCGLRPPVAGHVARPAGHAGPHGGRDGRLCRRAHQRQLLRRSAHR
jgi:hypothetical protein